MPEITDADIQVVLWSLVAFLAVMLIFLVALTIARLNDIERGRKEREQNRRDIEGKMWK